MSETVPQWSRWSVIVGLLVAAGSCVAAMNWHSTWTSFARLDAESSGGAISMLTVEAQANYQRWVLVALVSLVIVAVVMASELLARTNPGSPNRSVSQVDRFEAPNR